ncbi:MAG: hypothetical protein ACJ8M1_00170 [Chthoniobacterales bacterium]
MKHPTIYSFCLAALFIAVASSTGFARPVDFGEVSLWVRAHDSESSIRDEVSRRKLMHPLTAQQETTLKSQGASDSLVQSLRNTGNLAPKDEVASLEATRPAAHDKDQTGGSERGARVTVMNVAFGHSINLSQWGGADYDIAFYSYRVAGEDHIQPAIVDNVRTGTDVSRTIPLISEDEAFTSSWFPTNETRNWRYTPYSARADLRDNRFNFSDSVAVSSRSFSRPLQIDWDNPVRIDGQPYNFFHVYGAGGVSLYFIGKASDRSATVAVVSDRAL